MLEFQDFRYLTHEVTNLKEMITYVIHHLQAFLQSTGSQLRPLHNSVRIFFNSWFSVCCKLFNAFLSQLSSMRVPGYHPPPKLGILMLKLYGITKGCSLFHPAGWGIPGSNQTLQPKASSSSHTKSHELLVIHRPLYIHDAVS
jgi:hypothetical protein